MPATKNPACAEAERIHALGARATPARIAVLRLLGGAERALSHRDVELALQARFDRVTLYRVLDWLVEGGLAHRVTDADRVFRFSLANDGSISHEGHAHFHCESCGKVFCLDTVPVPAVALPSGFSQSAATYNITGHCARCESSETKEK